jgi:hypothetical protein
MASQFSSDIELLRAEIAAAAARLIAEDGLDYNSAKRKAAKQILGNNKVRGDILPDNSQLEEEVRIYNALFFGDTQPGRLLQLRQFALALMQELAEFRPHLTGAVLNGTAGEHSDIHLHLFVDSPKDVEIFLLNKDVTFEVSENAHPVSRKDPIETLSFMWRHEGVHLTLYSIEDMRQSRTLRDGRAIERADIQTVIALLNESEE